jgi:hypothetical protein
MLLKWSLKICDLLKEVQLIWNTGLLNRGDCMGRFDYYMYVGVLWSICFAKIVFSEKYLVEGKTWDA